MVKLTALSVLAVFAGVTTSHRTRHMHPVGHSIRIRGNNSTAPPPGYSTEVFMDDFSSDTLNTEYWKYDVGFGYKDGPPNWGTHEVQNYTNSEENIKISNGNLVITPRKSDSGWTSARIETTANVKIGAEEGGKVWIEANIKVGSAGLEESQQLGIWPAFWMMGDSFRDDRKSWPAVGEIDIMETANGQNLLLNTVHCDQETGGVCNEHNGIGNGANPTEFKRGEWHQIGVEIDRSSSDMQQQSINFYLDRQMKWSLKPENIQNHESAWEALTASNKLLLLNVAVGGDFPDARNNGDPTPDDNTMDGEDVGIEVEYVAAWTA